MSDIDTPYEDLIIEAKKIKNESERNTKINQIKEAYYRKINNIIDADTIQVERAIAERILKEDVIFCFPDSNELVIYGDGYFQPNVIAVAKIRAKMDLIAKTVNVTHSSNKTEKLSPYNINPAKRNTIFEMIRSSTFCDRLEFSPPNNMIFCTNGIYFTDLKEFHTYQEYKHNPYKTLYQLPVEYNPDIKSTRWDKFLLKIVGDKEKARLIYMMIAYFLMNHVKYQKAFILHGPPDSGRTTLMDAIIRFIGGDSWGKYISNIRLQDLEVPFTFAQLRHKLLNCFDDLESDDIIKSEKFRISVTNKHLKARIKHVQEWVEWINRVKHLFSCNDLPNLKKNPGVQFWRRWILIQCYSLFKNKEDMTPEDYNDPRIFEKDGEMYEKLTTPEALSGLLNVIIQAWRILEKENHFPSKWSDVDYIEGLWMINTNPVKLFVAECCEIGDYEVDYQIFFNALNEFRERKKANKISTNMMTRGMKMLGIPNFNANKNIKKKYHKDSCGRSYVGIKLKKMPVEVDELTLMNYKEGDS